MKTTIELPEPVFRQAKVLSASRGMTLKQLFTEALEEKLRRCNAAASGRGTDPPWTAGFGELSDLADENCAILDRIEGEFESLAP